jgi:hypothetical protein
MKRLEVISGFIAHLGLVDQFRPGHPRNSSISIEFSVLSPIANMT